MTKRFAESTLLRANGGSDRQRDSSQGDGSEGALERSPMHRLSNTLTTIVADWRTLVTRPAMSWYHT
jgi:hypothetical protein